MVSNKLRNRCCSPRMQSTRRGTIRGGRAGVAVFDSAESIRIELDLPGVKHEQIEIEFEKDILRIRAERTGVSDGVVSDSRRLGWIEQAFRVGVPVDSTSIDAALSDGVLQITLTKSEDARPHRIPVRSATPTGPDVATDQGS